MQLQPRSFGHGHGHEVVREERKTERKDKRGREINNWAEEREKLKKI